MVTKNTDTEDRKEKTMAKGLIARLEKEVAEANRRVYECSMMSDLRSEEYKREVQMRVDRAEELETALRVVKELMQ